MTWAWDQRVPPNAKLVLMALADHAHDDGTNAWPSVALLARKTGYGERQVQRILAELVNTGLIRVQTPGGKGANAGPTVYALNVDTTFALQRGEFRAIGCPPALRAAVIERDGRVCQLCHEPGDEVAGPDGHPWEADRIRSGGPYVSENVRLTCRTCNRRRGHERGDILTPPGDILSPPGVTDDVRGATPETPEPSEEPSGTVKYMRAAFDEFWSTYPRKAGKRAAITAYERALKRADAATILVGAQCYRDDPNRVDAFTAHAATWLNQDRWTDDPLPARNAGRPEPVPRTATGGW